MISIRVMPRLRGDFGSRPSFCCMAVLIFIRNEAGELHDGHEDGEDDERHASAITTIMIGSRRLVSAPTRISTCAS